MPRLDGLEATRRVLAEPTLHATSILILTTFDLDEYVYTALRAGASGFLLKDAPPEQLIAGIRTVASGDSLLAPSITRRLIESYLHRHAPPTADAPGLGELTAREREVLELVARGHSNAEIASQLWVSDATVKTHVAHLLSKLQLRDRVQAVVYAYETGLVHPNATARGEPN
jgi:DNA-binding NarL/FixJ family response regulator